MSKIGIDVYSALHNPRGMGVYTINFLKELAKLDKETKYILYADVEDEHNVLPRQENFEFRKLPSKGLFHYEQFVLPSECKKDKIQILHSPANTSPIFLDKRIKRIVTIHDVIFLKKDIPLPNNKKQLLGRIYYCLTALLNTRNANSLFTVSEFSKQDIIKLLNIKNKDFQITPNGHEHFDTIQSTNFPELQEKYKIPNKYFFHLGGEAPSKNTELLLQIFTKNEAANLVVAGIREPQISPFAKKYCNYKNIIFVPYISQADLVGIYKNAQAFIFPSIYEGFGIPLLEAMKSESPILCSNATCLPEVAGDAAIYFNPRDKKELEEKIKLIADNQDLRQDLISKGQERLKQFSWQKTAEIILKEYQKI